MVEKNKGFTLIEILVAIAIMGILVTMISPILDITTKSNMKEKVINEIDASLAKSVELIKRTARSAKTTTARNAITVTNSNREVTMNVPVDDESSTSGAIKDEVITFRYNSTQRTITAQSGTAGAVDVIASNVSNARFELIQGVLTIQIAVDLNRAGENEAWKRREIRDAAVTRLDVE
jgi:prepilin-type N-terminal cleavage/methylation domain-containing protein